MDAGRYNPDAQRTALNAAIEAQTNLAEKQNAPKAKSFTAQLGSKWELRGLEAKANTAMKELKKAGFDSINTAFKALYEKPLTEHNISLFAGTEDKRVEVKDEDLHALLDLEERMPALKKYEHETGESLGTGIVEKGVKAFSSTVSDKQRASHKELKDPKAILDVVTEICNRGVSLTQWKSPLNALVQRAEAIANPNDMVIKEQIAKCKTLITEAK